MSVYKGSRYTNTGVFVKNDVAILEIRKRENIDLNNVFYYTVVEGDTLDGISYKIYGNAQLYWAILDCNKKYLTELEIKPGDIIAIPYFNEVIKYV